MDKPSFRSAPPARGFTIIELMLVVAMVAVLLGLAVPTMREAIVRNTVASAGNELGAAIAQARGLSITHNSCATICAAAVSGTTTPACATPGARGWQGGWIVFSNPACDAAQTDPTAAGATLRLVRNAGTDDLSITASATALNRVMFDPRGLSTAGAGGHWQITPADDLGLGLARTLCMDGAGRVTVRDQTSTC